MRASDSTITAAAEHGHAVDAATRPQDHRFFETRNRPEVCTNLLVAAQLMPNPLGRARQRQPIASCPIIPSRMVSSIWHPSLMKAASMLPVSIIFLNGVSSSGKTSIAKVLQQTLPEPYLHVQLDSFEAMLPERYDEGGRFDWQALFPKALSGFHHSIAALATAGNNLIVDHVTVYREGWHSSLIECAYLLLPFQAYLIGVHCSLSELQRREHARGDRFIGTAIRQFDRVHRYGIADLTVDTSATTTDVCAEQVRAYINSHEPRAFQQLRART